MGNDDFANMMEEQNRVQWEEVGSGGGADAWDFNADPKIVGTYVSKKTNIGPNQSNMYIIKDQAGTEHAVWGSALLDSRFEEVAFGNMVSIEYLGKAKSKRGNTFKNYKFLVAR